jgi:hypothetical protein
VPPVAPAIVAAWLTERAAAGVSRSTLNVSLAAIKFGHKIAGQRLDGADSDLQRALAGARREAVRERRRAAPLRPPICHFPPGFCAIRPEGIPLCLSRDFRKQGDHNQPIARAGSSNASDVPGGVLQRNNIHLAVCDQGKVDETLRALRASPRNEKGKVKFILATDAIEFEAEDIATGRHDRLRFLPTTSGSFCRWLESPPSPTSKPRAV